jgi:glycosyltransferase involved in cell wall biosynthesis
MGRVVAAMAHAAQDAGWTVTLVGSDVDRAFVNTHQIPVVRRNGFPSRLATLLWMAEAHRRLRREDLSDAVVHVHAPLLMRHADVFTCHHLAEGAAKHGVREPVTGIGSGLRRLQEIINVKLDSLAYRSRPGDTEITFVSAFCRNVFTELYGVPRGGKILPLPAPPWCPVTAIERSDARVRYGVMDDDVAVGYFGGNDPRKGVAKVIELAGTSKYVVLGAGPASESIYFGRRRGLGYINVRSVLAACDVVVAPSLFDTGPISVLEAVAAGLPVVSGSNCGCAEALVRFGAGAVCAPDQSLETVIDMVLPGSPAAAKAMTESHSPDVLAETVARVWCLLA